MFGRERGLRHRWVRQKPVEVEVCVGQSCAYGEGREALPFLQGEFEGEQGVSVKPAKYCMSECDTPTNVRVGGTLFKNTKPSREDPNMQSVISHVNVFIRKQ